MQTLFFPILFAASLCADCFAVSLCSSVTLDNVRRADVIRISSIFAILQTSLLVIGWAFGDFLGGFVGGLAGAVGFALLLFVGGSMVKEGIAGEGDIKNLNGLKNVIIGGIATSIDALAAGASLSLEDKSWGEFRILAAAVFVVTAISVVAGVYGGKTIGGKAGRVAEIVGGCVLIGIGIGFTI